MNLTKWYNLRIKRLNFLGYSVSWN